MRGIISLLVVIVGLIAVINYFFVVPVNASQPLSENSSDFIETIENNVPENSVDDTMTFKNQLTTESENNQPVASDDKLAKVYAENIRLREITQKQSVIVKELMNTIDSEEPSEEEITEKVNLDTETYIDRDAGEFSFHIPFSQYFSSRVHNKHLSENFADYVVIIPEIENIVKEVKEKYSTEKEVADALLDIVHSFKYLEEQDEFFKYPIETIVEGNGDCEDLSIFMVALFKTAGFDAALIVSPGHVQAGIQLEGVVGNTVIIEGSEYLIVETTDDTSSIGSGPVPDSFYGQTV